MTVRIRLREEEQLRPRSHRWAEYLFLILGLIGVDYYVWVQAEAALYQQYANWALDRELSGLTANVPEYMASRWALLWGDKEDAKTATHTTVIDKRPAPPVWRPRQSEIIGRIDIPRLHLTAMVREGTDEGTLMRAVGHVPSTALPGRFGNVALAGHRDTFFRGLRNVRKNDVVSVTTLNGTFRYRVESIQIVDPNQISVLNASAGQQVLTLITCYPFNYIGSAPYRYIVRARREGPIPPPLQGS